MRNAGLVSLCALNAVMSSAGGVVAADLHPGDILTVDALENSVVLIDPQTGDQELITSGGFLGLPVSVAVDPGGRILVGNAGNSILLVAVDASTGAQTAAAFAAFYSILNSFGVDAAGNVVAGVVSEPLGGGGAVTKFSSVFGIQQVVAGGNLTLGSINAVRIDDDGSIVIAEFDGIGGSGTPRRIARVDQQSGEIQDITINGMRRPNGLVIEDSGDFLVLDDGWGESAKLFRVDASNGYQDLLLDNLPGRSPRGLDMEPTGDLVYADQHLTIYRIDMSSFDVSEVSTSGLLRFAASVAVVPDVGAIAASCAGDIDDNKQVDVNDITYVMFNLGETGEHPADVDRSRLVDANDITLTVLRLGPCGDAAPDASTQEIVVPNMGGARDGTGRVDPAAQSAVNAIAGRLGEVGTGPEDVDGDGVIDLHDLTRAVVTGLAGGH